eukprot:s8406_g3.t1
MAERARTRHDLLHRHPPQAGGLENAITESTGAVAARSARFKTSGPQQARVLLPSTENEEVLKANAERLVKHTFDMVKQVRLAWVQAAVQEDYKKTNIALLPEDKLFHHVMTEKLPEEDRAAWEAALQEDSPESLHQGAANSLEVTARRRRAFHAPVAEKTKASDYKGHGPARKRPTDL